MPSGRQEEREISFRPDEGIAGRIANFQRGDCAIEDVWAEYSGVRVDKVPVGKNFDIKCTYRFQDLEGRVEIPNSSKCSITAIETGVSSVSAFKANFNTNVSPRGKLQRETVTLNNYAGPLVMPDRNMTLRVRLWGRDSTATAWPSESLW